ncbi:MAG: phosphate ABC transporter permease subunit PstC [Deltaproteobacteria bacterium]|jgi:phosphate transport system permease protein|nr:phosphate ABC transporter permease subunit PstC [Deltaproteobacteria bacterium]
MSADHRKNLLFKALTCLAAVSVLGIVVGILAVILMESFPALKHFGIGAFLGGRDWNYTREIYGALRPLTGTVVSTGIALLAAVPLSLGTAVFLTEICPHRLRGAFGAAIELLAAIPSIIYGMWGLFVLAPFLDEWVQPAVGSALGGVPLIGSFFVTKSAGGVNLFSASLVLAVMIIPFITSIARDAFEQVPDVLKESSYALGATRWETVRKVVSAQSASAVGGGVIIAMGRALGETMAVAYVIGNRHASLDSLFSPYTTITSVIANEFNEAGGIQLSSLFTLALVLFIANFLALGVGRRLVKGKEK